MQRILMVILIRVSNEKPGHTLQPASEKNLWLS